MKIKQGDLVVGPMEGLSGYLMNYSARQFSQYLPKREKKGGKV
ncbi:MAG: hypothetical protein Ct9H300mP28_30580 [Pseudomonadota bacterium]|nr:MAG: hypothetical protein Ct9H300mP28_30580 [Pseudomonadota bacterium]